MNIQVVWVVKQEQSLLDSATAKFIITEDDIRRNDVTGIFNAPRMTSGTHFARNAGWLAVLYG